MRLNSRDRMVVQNVMEEQRPFHRDKEGVSVYTQLSSASCPDCGYDPLVGAVDAGCVTCGGTGRIITYKKYQSFPRVGFPKLTDFVVGLGGGIEVGDVLLYANTREQEIYEECRLNGYLTMDGDRYAVQSVSSAGFGNKDEIIVTCARQEQ